MSYVGHYTSWPVEVGQVETGVVYQVHADGRVYRLEPPPSGPGPGRVQLVGNLELLPTALPDLWDACEAVYWDAVTDVRIPVDVDLTPVQPVSVRDVLRGV